MKLLAEIRDAEELTRDKSLLEAAGVPVFIGNSNAMALYPRMVNYRYSLWVVLDEQYLDAKKILAGKLDMASNPVDVQTFYLSLKREKVLMEDRVHSVLMRWGVGVALILLLAVVAYLLLSN